MSLRSGGEEIIKNWLTAIINDLGLDSLKSFPSGDLVSAFPQLIAGLAQSITSPTTAFRDDAEIKKMAGLVAGLRKEGFSLAQLVDDYSTLKAFLLEAAARNMRQTDREMLLIFRRLDRSFVHFFKEGLSAYMESHSRELERLAHTDSLTGLFNVRYFRKQLTENLEMYHRYKIPFSLLMLDVDKLKEINDTLGHLAGDQALKTLADIMGSEKRTTDVAVRYGGDEFFLILPGIGAGDEAERLAQRITGRVTKLRTESKNREMTSVSIGIVTCPEDGTEMEELISRSDRALYEAKLSDNGRIARFREGPEIVG